MCFIQLTSSTWERNTTCCERMVGRTIAIFSIETSNFRPSQRRPHESYHRPFRALEMKTPCVCKTFRSTRNSRRLRSRFRTWRNGWRRWRGIVTLKSGRRSAVKQLGNPFVRNKRQRRRNQNTGRKRYCAENKRHVSKMFNTNRRNGLNFDVQYYS